MPIETGSFSFGFVAGGAVVGVINHFLAKSRDIESRGAKDFNDAADALAEILTNERSDPSTSSNIDFFALRRVLNDNELLRFNKCVTEYESVKENSPIKYDDEGSIYVRSSGRYKDTKEIVAAIEKLLTFTKRK